MGFQGYPKISIQYTGEGFENAVIHFQQEEGAQVMEQTFHSKLDAREDDVIQSAIVKTIERSEAKTVEFIGQ